jgi:acyl-CoA synthetase (AMP-forming)/AMP-acid ligase II
VKAFVVLRAGGSATTEELVAHCRQRIASYKLPRSVEYLAALPRIASTNKVDKKTLRAPYWSAQGRQVA